MKEFKGCRNYRVISEEKLEDFDSVGIILEHEKTKARVALVNNCDNNKSFVIGFKTPRNDSTGVPHILEHSVLCGSEKYPVKDAMTEVMKGSVNTFINAFTYPDRTLYPFSSCNDKDFDNILSVYLDAVFNPRVYDDERIFMQEGWHYELENIEDELKINGVVYNEMKGAYSSPDELLRNEIFRTLFPDTQYFYDAGGNPECIPDLSYEQFVDFHKKLYHPSNCRIILYGDMDFEKKLEFIDKEYLSKFDFLSFATDVKLQKAFDKRVEVSKDYPVSEGEPLSDNTYLSYNMVVSDFSDCLTNQSISVINYALCSVPGALLKERLIKAGIGKDVYSEYTDDVAQKVFSIIAEGANEEDKERFVNIIEDTLRDIIKEGYDKKALEAAVTSMEFGYRESDFGSFPKSIFHSLCIMDEYIYSDNNVFNQLKQGKIFETLRKGIDERYFEKLTEKLLLNNNHKSVVVLTPKAGLMDETDKKLSDRLKKVKDGLTKEQLEKIVKDTIELKKYQEEPDSQEALSAVPTLKLSDVDRVGKHTDYTVKYVDGIKVVTTALNSAGVAYISLSFNANGVEERLLDAFSILKGILTGVDTQNFSYADLNNEMNIRAGGINITNVIYKDLYDTDKFDLSFEVRTKSFYKNIPDVFELIKEILFTSNLNDKVRIKEILEEAKSRISASMISSGHVVAYQRALSKVSKAAKLSEKLSGIDKFRMIEELLADYDNRIDKMISDMKEILDIVLVKENLEVGIGAQESSFEDIFKSISDFAKALKDTESKNTVLNIEKTPDNEAYTSSMQVQYVATAGNFIKKGLKYDSRLSIIRNILNNDYLWVKVRIQNGAYGCFFSVSRNGDCYFASYRDPNLKKTLDTYRAASEYFKNFDADDKLLERYIISVIGELDTPLTPSQEAAKAFGMYKTGLTNETVDKDRENILNAKLTDIRELSKYLEVICEDNAVCVVGNDSVIKASQDLVDKIYPLIRDL